MSEKTRHVPLKGAWSIITGSGSRPRRRWLRDRFALPPDNRERGYAISTHPIYPPADNNLAKADRHVAARRRRYGRCGLAARQHPTMRGRTVAPLSRQSTLRTGSSLTRVG